MGIRHWWQNKLVWILTASAVFGGLAGYLVYLQIGKGAGISVGMGAGAAIAAERVLEPDRIYSPPPAPPKPYQPLLFESENMRSETRYAGKTTTIAVEEADLYRGFLVIVNAGRPLHDSYIPEDLVIADDAAQEVIITGYNVTKPGLEINQTVDAMLKALVLDAWDAENLGGFLLQSGYRDYAYQITIHRRKIQEYRAMGYSEASAGDAAAFWVARPGESEHQTGLAADLSSRSHPELEPSYADTANGSWLAENCWRYGFIIRYPKDKTEITNIGYEPWHLRYTGKPHSELIYQNRWCLEEYLDFLQTKRGVTFRDGAGSIWQIDYQTADIGLLKVASDLPYTVSGDGASGYIITTQME